MWWRKHAVSATKFTTLSASTFTENLTLSRMHWKNIVINTQLLKYILNVKPCQKKQKLSTAWIGKKYQILDGGKLGELKNLLNLVNLFNIAILNVYLL